MNKILPFLILLISLAILPGLDSKVFAQDASTTPPATDKVATASDEKCYVCKTGKYEEDPTLTTDKCATSCSEDTAKKGEVCKGAVSQVGVICTVVDTKSEDGTWVKDEETTVVGKFAARSAHVLNWTLANYKWSYLKDGDKNPFAEAYKASRNIVYALLSLFILASAFLLILTRGREIKVIQFISRFITAVILVTIAYSLVIFIYQVVDIIQGFFLRSNSKIISSADLLNIAFNYGDFIGYKKTGAEFSESALISLWLTRLTAITYFLMSGVLVVRKAILWFFLIVSPIFPLLLLLRSARGIYKIWLGEFLRWLFYAPLFAILLSGLVTVWQLYIPANLDLPCQEKVDPSKAVYPTAINILLGGPCQSVSVENSLNTPDSFLEYAIALIMLWMVMLVPFLLLHMLIESISNYSFSESPLAKYVLDHGRPMFEKYRRGAVPPIPPTDHPSGLAKVVPISRIFVDKTGYGSFSGDNAFTSDIAQNISASIDNQSVASAEAVNTASLVSQNQMTAEKAMVQNQANRDARVTANRQRSQTSISNVSSSAYPHLSSKVINLSGDVKTEAVNIEILNLTNLSIPTMHDISRYETSFLPQTEPVRVETINKIGEALNRLAGTSVLMTNQEKQVYQQITERIKTAAHANNPLASSILSATNPGHTIVLPEINQIQQVKLEDYEEVKKTWKENYHKMDPSLDTSGQSKTRKQWLTEEKDQIVKVINLLLSDNPEDVKKGQQMISKILPFLLLGGFSKAEIISYLKAKQQAAKEVLEETKDSEEEYLVPAKTAQQQTPANDKHMAAVSTKEDNRN